MKQAQAFGSRAKPYMPLGFERFKFKRASTCMNSEYTHCGGNVGMTFHRDVGTIVNTLITPTKTENSIDVTLKV